MTKNAEERLFEAFGQISDELVTEADCSRLDDADGDVSGEAAEQVFTDGEPEKVQKQHTVYAFAAKLGGFLKYLPAAACLCIVFGSVFYVVNHEKGAGNSASFSMSGSSADAGGGASGDVRMDDADGSAFDTEPDAGSDSAERKEDADMPESGAAWNEESAENGTADSADGQAQLPVRYGAYSGPVFALTATGDTQKLTAARSLKADILTEESSAGMQPLLQITDTYQIKNTSDRDKTVQILYPFTGVLNQAQEPDGDILTVSGQEHPKQVSYSFGASIAEYQNLESFQQALDGEAMKDYQEQALEKEADWGREVTVYTFTMEKEENTAPCVAGITVRGAGADVLTFGFDHSFEREEDTAYYCFFAPGELEQAYLIVTGEMEGEPETGFYTNLDCDEKAEGMPYQMQRQKMAYTDALRLCSGAAARQMEQDYESGIYDASLPEYMDADAANRALTMISEEEDFYDTLTKRYGTTELQEIFERIFGETRIVYAMTAVTVPAGKTVKVTARSQKQQENGHYILGSGPQDTEEFRYDFLSAGQSRLKIKKTAFRLKAEEAWQLAGQNMGLVQKRKTVWKTVPGEDDGYFILRKTNVLNQKH